MIRTTWTALAACLIGSATGCRSYLIDGSDGRVYDVIQDRQRAALGETADAHIGAETGEIGESDRMYRFNPRPLSAELPSSIETPARSRERVSPEPPEEADAVGPPSPAGVSREPKSADKPGDVPLESEVEKKAGPILPPDIFTDEQRPHVTVFGLREALRYAAAHGRDLQDAKETLYLAALDLTLERHLWTPQFVSTISAEFADFGQVRDFDRAMTAVSDFAVSQRLPYGGEVTARIVSSLMRDLGVHTTSGESGSVILSADLPLLRGAGKVAYESRFLAERELIYAVRTFERFRRTFLVDVAATYFNLQGLKSAIANTYKSYGSRRDDWIRSDFINQMGQSRDIFEAPRARSSFRRSESALVSAKERYETALDQFKIFIGMPVETLLDVVAQQDDTDATALDDLFPAAEQDELIDVALRYRLDFLNSADRLDDAKRGVTIAENAILPDLDARLSATVDSDPEDFNTTSFNLERTTWRGQFELRMDDRMSERNAFRASLVTVRRSERDHELLADRLRADVRRAVRRVRQQQDLRDIQELQVAENLLRAEAARENFRLGIRTNQDVVDAEDELLAARNDLADAVSAYRIAILELRRDTGTLRVGDDGAWRDGGKPSQASDPSGDP